MRDRRANGREDRIREADGIPSAFKCSIWVLGQDIEDFVLEPALLVGLKGLPHLGIIVIDAALHGVAIPRLAERNRGTTRKHPAKTARIAAEASKPGGDPLLDEAVAKVNAAKYSFGRDVANFFLPKDLEGKSGLYTWISGTGDAAFRIFLDPTIVLGKVAKAYNAGKFALTKTIGSAAKVDNAFQYDSVSRFWTEYTKGLDDLVKARASEKAIEVGEATTRLRRLNPALGANGVDDALIKFAKDDMDGVLDVNTAKAFLSNVERIEPLFYGQAGLQIKVMPMV